MDASLGQVMRAMIGAGVETFVATAGRALEHDPLPSADHRPWPLPSEPWVMAQAWHHALFAHWALAPRALRRFVPAGVALDLFDGVAWVGTIYYLFIYNRVLSGGEFIWLHAEPYAFLRPKVRRRVFKPAAVQTGNDYYRYRQMVMA